MMSDIWHGFAVLAGRWQPLHNGHLWIIKKMLSESKNVVLAIVNPDPARPPDRAFDRFRRSVNPLSYWERYWILSQVMGALSVQSHVRILPSWHPRVSVEPERYFLPPEKKLLWYVPLASDEEEQKASDFRERGLKVHVVRRIPAEILRFSAVGVRQQMLRMDNGAMEEIPDAARTACERIGFNIQDTVRYAYDSMIGVRPRPVVEVAVFPGEYSPPDVGHLEVIASVLEKHDIVHLGVLVDFDGHDDQGWPRGLAVDDQNLMTYWERYESLHLSIVKANWYDRITIGPIFRNRLNGSIEYAPFIPEPCIWVVDDSEQRGGDLIGWLTQQGERIHRLRPTKASQDGRNAIAAALRAGYALPVDAMAKGSELFVKDLFLETRCRVSQKHQTKHNTGGIMGGTQFFGSVTVHGNVINIEGNCYNMTPGDMGGFQSVLSALVRSSLPSEQLGIAAASIVRLVETIEMAPDNVRTASESVARAMASDPRMIDRLKHLANGLAVGASGSLIATAITEGLRIVIGG